jgi:hypothetical protein
VEDNLAVGIHDYKIIVNTLIVFAKDKLGLRAGVWIGSQ